MRWFLLPLAFLFFMAQWSRRKLYLIGILKKKRLKQPVICVGNLTTGGTGKTPWVQKIAMLVEQQGAKLCILSRGYSGDFDGVLEVTPDMDPRKCGDEPLWLKNKTQASVYVSRSRVDAAQRAIAEVRPDVFLLDDGFQHFKLHRDLDIALIDVSAPLKNYQMLPVGRMREPFSALQRSSLVILNKCNFVDEEKIATIVQWIEGSGTRANVLRADFVVDQWEKLIPEIDGERPLKNVSMTCGLGNPGSFLQTLEQLDIELVKKYIFPDHYYWKPNDIELMTYGMKQVQSYDLIMTEKDAVKLNRYKKHFQEMGIQMWICKMKISMHESDQILVDAIQKVVSKEGGDVSS